MRVLAIDTSCDDTCIALAQCSGAKFKLIANLISSQVKIHKKWGGVYPALARREHQRNIVPLLAQALREAKLLKPKAKSPAFAKASAGKQKSKVTVKNLKLKNILKREEVLYKQLWKFLQGYQKPRIDLIAVTVGPGLDPCLWTGINFAKALSCFWQLSILPVNHIEAHIYANWLRPVSVKSKVKSPKSKIKVKNRRIELPAVCLIVSGGHTQLILIEKLGKYKILGETRDDAAGEAFDKIARILGLSYPGGPAIAIAAAKYSKSPNIDMSKYRLILPRPMMYSNDYDFSFSGLKTAVLYDYKTRPKKERGSKEYIQAMAKETQQAIIDVLLKKTIRAARNNKAKSIILGGGVAANQELRKQFQSIINNQQSAINFWVPSKSSCTDNAAMVAVVACLGSKQTLETVNWQKIKALPNLRIN